MGGKKGKRKEKLIHNRHKQVKQLDHNSEK